MNTYPSLSLRVSSLSLRAKRGNLIAFSSHPKIATGLTPLAMTAFCMFWLLVLEVLNLFRV